MKLINVKVFLILLLHFSSFLISVHVESKIRSHHASLLEERRRGKAYSNTKISNKEKAKAFLKGTVFALFQSTAAQLCIDELLESDEDDKVAEVQTTLSKNDIQADLATVTSAYTQALKDWSTAISKFLNKFAEKKKSDFGSDTLGTLNYNKMLENQRNNGLGKGIDIVNKQKGNLDEATTKLAQKKYYAAYLELQGVQSSLDDLETKYKDLKYAAANIQQTDVKDALTATKTASALVTTKKLEFMQTSKNLDSFSKTKTFLEKIKSAFEKIKKKFQRTWEKVKTVAKCFVEKALEDFGVTTTIKNQIKDHFLSIIEVGANFMTTIASVIPGINFIVYAIRVIRLVSPLFQCLKTFLDAVQIADDAKRFTAYGVVFGNLLKFLLYIFTGIQMDFNFDVSNANAKISFTEESESEKTSDEDILKLTG